MTQNSRVVWLVLVVVILAMPLQGCVLNQGVSDEERTFKQVFYPTGTGGGDSASMNILENTNQLLDSFENNSLKNFKGFVTGQRFLFMPNPGEPRRVASVPVAVEDISAFYADIYIDTHTYIELNVGGEVTAISSHPLSGVKLSELSVPLSVKKWYSINIYLLDGVLSI